MPVCPVESNHKHSAEQQCARALCVCVLRSWQIRGTRCSAAALGAGLHARQTRLRMSRPLMCRLPAAKKHDQAFTDDRGQLGLQPRCAPVGSNSNAPGSLAGGVRAECAGEHADRRRLGTKPWECRCAARDGRVAGQRCKVLRPQAWAWLSSVAQRCEQGVDPRLRVQPIASKIKARTTEHGFRTVHDFTSGKLALYDALGQPRQH